MRVSGRRVEIREESTDKFFRFGVGWEQKAVVIVDGFVDSVGHRSDYRHTVAHCPADSDRNGAVAKGRYVPVDRG